MIIKYCIKIILALLLLITSLNASLYSTRQVVPVDTRSLITGEFDTIVRFDMITFDDGEVDEKSLKTLARAIDKTKAYINTGNNVIVTLIGHTNELIDDANEHNVKSRTYASLFCNIFTSCLTPKEAEEKKTKYALSVKKILINNNIDSSIIVVDTQSEKDLAYDDGTDFNGAMITLYVKKYKHASRLHKDSDDDGIEDRYDQCADTPRGSNVDSEGCAYSNGYADNEAINSSIYSNNSFVESDKSHYGRYKRDRDEDGVLDENDACSLTPLGVLVDRRGCPIDSDGDGVFDYQDKCPNTRVNTHVDKNGCKKTRVVSKVLGIKFETGSSRIMYESFPEVRSLAKYLKTHPTYRLQIIGYTDNVGSVSNNLILSKRRAQAVKEALVLDGIKSNRLRTYGKGEASPIARNDTRQGREKNRRIEVRLFY